MFFYLQFSYYSLVQKHLFQYKDPFVFQIQFNFLNFFKCFFKLVYELHYSCRNLVHIS